MSLGIRPKWQLCPEAGMCYIPAPVPSVSPPTSIPYRLFCIPSFMGNCASKSHGCIRTISRDSNWVTQVTAQESLAQSWHGHQEKLPFQVHRRLVLWSGERQAVLLIFGHGRWNNRFRNSYSTPAHCQRPCMPDFVMQRFKVKCRREPRGQLDNRSRDCAITQLVPLPPQRSKMA